MSNDAVFSHLDFSQKQIVYQGLLALVTSNSGVGFTNNDQGHPAYAIGREGKFDCEQWGDSPDRNRLFKMMHELSVALSEAEIDGSSEVVDYIFSWADFCNIAYSAHQHSKTNKR